MKAHGLTTRMLVVCNRQKISEALTSAKSFVGHRCFQMSHHVLLQKPTSTLDSGSFRQMVIHFDVRPKWSYLIIQSKRVQSPRIYHLLYFISSYISKWSFFLLHIEYIYIYHIFISLRRPVCYWHTMDTSSPSERMTWDNWA